MKHSADYLLQMVRQIALNQPKDFDDETNAQRVATHLQRFWAPSMIKEARAIQADELEPVAARALELLEEST